MAIRICPKCGKQVPATAVVAYSDTLVCPHCHSPLRVSDVSRIIGAFIALAVGALVWRWSRGMPPELPWFGPEVHAFLAYSFAYAGFLMATADLSMRALEAAPEPLGASAHGHGPASTGGHGGAQH
ncbi:MAG TPA: hypothetical protein VN862_11185 [Candidatus Acidoferrales bacterium]|nr:hypothetical protein [Candidatus Acidoferrales bacterium]